MMMNMFEKMNILYIWMQKNQDTHQLGKLFLVVKKF